MKLTIEQWAGVRAALLALDGSYERVIDDGKNKRVVITRYSLPKHVRIDNGSRLWLLEAPLKAYDTQREELVKQYGKVIGEEFKVPPEALVEFNREKNELLAVEVELDLSELDFEDLNLDENPIASAVLCMLEPIRKGR